MPTRTTGEFGQDVQNQHKEIHDKALKQYYRMLKNGGATNGKISSLKKELAMVDVVMQWKQGNYVITRNLELKWEKYTSTLCVEVFSGYDYEEDESFELPTYKRIYQNHALRDDALTLCEGILMSEILGAKIGWGFTSLGPHHRMCFLLGEKSPYQYIIVRTAKLQAWLQENWRDQILMFSDNYAGQNTWLGGYVIVDIESIPDEAIEQTFVVG